MSRYPLPPDGGLTNTKMGEHAFNDTSKYASITFTAGGAEALRIAPDGFYVRGTKLPQDEHEARAVYDAMVRWLKDHGQL